MRALAPSVLVGGLQDAVCILTRLFGADDAQVHAWRIGDSARFQILVAHEQRHVDSSLPLRAPVPKPEHSLFSRASETVAQVLSDHLRRHVLDVFHAVPGDRSTHVPGEGVDEMKICPILPSRSGCEHRGGARQAHEIDDRDRTFQLKRSECIRLLPGPRVEGLGFRCIRVLGRVESALDALERS